MFAAARPYLSCRPLAHSRRAADARAITRTPVDRAAAAGAGCATIGAMTSAAPRQVALIAHDKKKLELALFALAHRDVLAHFPLVATGTTGGILQKQTGLSVERVLSCPPTMVK